MSMSLSADLSDLAEYFESLAGEPLPEAYRAAFIKPELEAVFSDKLYFRSPLFDALMAEVGTQAVSGAWYATDAVMSFGALYESMYGGNEDYTVGKALYAAMKQGDANRFYERLERYGAACRRRGRAVRRRDLHQVGQRLQVALRQGGACEAADGSGHGCRLPGFIADSGVEELSIDLTMRSDGGVELKYTASTSVNEEAALRINYTLAGNSSRMTAKGNGAGAQRLRRELCRGGQRPHDERKAAHASVRWRDGHRAPTAMTIAA